MTKIFFRLSCPFFHGIVVMLLFILCLDLRLQLPFFPMISFTGKRFSDTSATTIGWWEEEDWPWVRLGLFILLNFYLTLTVKNIYIQLI